MPARTRHAAMADHEALLDALKALTAERDEERRIRLAAESRLNASSAASARKLDQERRIRLAAESRLNASLAASARALDQERRLRLVAESRLSASLAASRTLDEERRLRLVAESQLSASTRTLDEERGLRLTAESRLNASLAASARALNEERLLRLQERLRRSHAPGRGSQSVSLSSKKDSHIADREIEVQALQDKLDALLAAGLDTSKALSYRDSEIASLRARVVELEVEKEHIGVKKDDVSTLEKAPYVAKAEKLKAEYTKKMDAYNNPQAGGPEASGDSDKSKSEINDEEGGGSENDE